LAIVIAEACAPCILWIDELEKGISSSHDGDSGTSRRVSGTILTWMQEKTKQVFILATANDIKKLPPEFVRKGRFDETFFLGLPNEVERVAIIKVHSIDQKIQFSDSEITSLAQASQGFSGAEIEEAIKASKFDVFDQGKQLTVESVLQAIKDTVPLSVTRREDITYLKEWAKTSAVPASKSFLENSKNQESGRWLNIEF
jgi:SpoVK/Ycf46/Vps4 family AAA+-type ATPase